jgi:hypothetical protein
MLIVSQAGGYFLIQRQLCSFRNWPDVAEFYAIPTEVLKRMGSSRAPGE